MINTASSEITVRIATTPAEYAQAFKIAYDVYFPKGYASYSEHGMRATPYQFRPGTIVFLAYANDKAVATMSIYEGQGSDLPSASGWPEELAELDRRGLRWFEAGALMVLPEGTKVGGMRLCMEMFRAAWRYARYIKNAKGFCGFVQSHHQAFYEKMLSFKKFGPAKDYMWNGLNIKAVLPIIWDIENDGPEFEARYNQHGETPRNLNWFFMRDKPEERLAELKSDVARWRELDMVALRRKFAHLLPVEKKAAQLSEVEIARQEAQQVEEGAAGLACASA